MTTDNTQELDEILSEFGCQAIRKTLGIAGLSIEQKEAKQAILDWHNKQVFAIIGEDEKPARESSPLEKSLFTDYKRIDYRNELRAEQRNNLKESE